MDTFFKFLGVLEAADVEPLEARITLGGPGEFGGVATLGREIVIRLREPQDELVVDQLLACARELHLTARRFRSHPGVVVSLDDDQR